MNESLDLAIQHQALEIELALSAEPAQASAEVAGMPPRSAGVETTSLPPIFRDEVSRLVELFETFGGFVPGFELTANNFQIHDLLNRKLIAPPASHLDGNCYLIGTELRRAVQRV